MLSMNLSPPKLNRLNYAKKGKCQTFQKVLLSHLIKTPLKQARKYARMDQRNGMVFERLPEKMPKRKRSKQTDLGRGVTAKNRSEMYHLR